MGAAALIGFTACQNDELMSDATGAETVVTFSAKLQNGQQTRAYADGSTAEVLKYVVYQAGTENAVYDITEVSIAGGSADVKLSLIKGQQYDIYFWADADGSPYTFNGKTVDINYEGEVAANDEKRDAFYASKLSYTASTGAQEVTLYRPFAQLNIGTADYNAVKSFFPLEEGSVAVTTTVSSTINLTDGSAEGESQVVTFTGVGLAEGNFPLEGYTYLSMNYLFVGEDVTEDVTMVATAAGTTVENTFTAVPFKANYRTNIAGNLLTSTSDWKVTIDASFNTPDLAGGPLWDGESVDMPELNEETGNYEINSAAQLAGFAALVNGTYGTETRSAVDYATMNFVLNSDIDLAGLEWTPIGLNNVYHGTFDGGNHTISNLKVTQPEAAGLFATARGLIKNVTVKNVEIAGNFKLGAIIGDGLCSHIENCHVDGGTITATVRQNTNGLNDDANNVGGIVGYLSAESKASVKDCSVKNLTITAYRDLGGIAGTINNSGCVVTGNTVSNVTIIADRTVEYYAEKDVNAHEVYGRFVNGGSLGEGNAFDNVEVMVKVDNAARMTAAVKGGATTVLLADGEYEVAGCTGKTLTVVGSSNTVLKVQYDGTEGGCDYGFKESNVTFKNITFLWHGKSDYSGYAYLNGTYKNCTFIGTYCLYGKSVFEDCTFNVNLGNELLYGLDKYCIWTWGAPSVDFNNCTFNTSGKAVLVYGGANTVLTANGCTFIDDEAKDRTGDEKAAIEADNYGVKTLILNNCTVDGFGYNPNGTPSNSKLWANKQDLSTDRLSVTVDGEKVY